MTHTDKQPQTVYVIKNGIPDEKTICFRGDKKLTWEWFGKDAESLGVTSFLQKHENILLHTPEELEALIRERERKAAEKALIPNADFYRQVWDGKNWLTVSEYLDHHYPQPK